MVSIRQTGRALRTTIEYMRGPLRFLETAARKGDVVPIDIIGQRMYLLVHPDHVNRVVVTEQKNFPKRHRFLSELKRFAGEGLATSDGELWRRQRSLIQPAFYKERIHGYVDDLAVSADRALAEWRPGETRDLYAEMMRILLDSVARSLFSAATPAGAREVAADVTVMMEYFASPGFLFASALERLPLPHIRRLKAAVERLNRTVAGIIAGRRRGGGQAAREHAKDLLATLLEARDADGSPMTDRQVRDEVFTLFLGGYEPSAVALGWMFHLLGQHPAALARAAGEARGVLGTRIPTRDDLGKLPWLTQVLSESLRLYPPAWSIAREVEEACEIGGHAIPAGGQVWCSQWVIHRDPRWYDAPLEFRPERWDGDLAKQLPRCAYFPYGGGPRICIGGALAQAQVLSLAAMVLSRWRLEPVAGRAPTPLPSINLRPHGGVWARLQRAS